MTPSSGYANINLMRRVLKSLVINALACWLVSQTFPEAMTFAKGLETLLFTAFVLGLVNLFIRPLINLFLLPINLLTLGTFRWVVNVITLYLVTLIVKDFSVNSFFFLGFSFKGIVIPSISFSLFWAFVFISFALSLVSSLVHWVFK